MRAIEVPEHGSADSMRLVDHDVPEPGPGQVRIRAEAIGVNFADIMQRRGTYPGGPEPPYVPGFEAAGVVDAVGEGVDFAEGDRVVGYPDGGAYREYALCPEGALFDVPAEIDAAEAAGFPVQFLTAHNCLFEWGGLEAGERVLIHAAAGGVGSAAVQLASRAGAEVFGTASSDAKLEYVAALGCEYPINYVESDFAEEITRVTDGGGVDLVLDGVGGETHDRSYDALNHYGRVVAYGAASGTVPRPDVWELLFHNYSVVGFHLGQSMQHDPDRVLGAVPELTALLAEGDVEINVGASFPLEAAADAHRLIEDRENVGKVVLTT
ncbi:MAG TPA: NADPH:quinone oxidoreductase family protein [Halobacteriales archaeon]|nr:NADPH:quinone oxidoreductase family protein [Halobacteriales archaeon]